MIVFSYFGVFLLACAFVTAAAEIPVRILFGGSGMFTSAYDLWYSLSPATLIITKNTVLGASPALWHQGIALMLALPAWLILGVPGMTLALRYRRRREYEEFDEDSLYLLDDLARQAREDGYEENDEEEIGTSYDEDEIYRQHYDPAEDDDHDATAQKIYLEEWDPKDSFHGDDAESERTVAELPKPPPEKL